MKTKPFKEVISYPAGNSFVIKYDDFPHFTVPWHFHNEYELVFIINSFGKKFAGDKVESFSTGDLSFYGTALPHFYLNDEAFYSGNPAYKVKAIVLQFPLDYFPAVELIRPEFVSIKKLLDSATRGLKFQMEAAEKGAQILNDILNASGIQRHLLLVKLMDYLGSSPSCPIASAGYSNSMVEMGESRMAKIYKYATRNCTRKITLDEISREVGMNSTAFCRYFQGKTGKTFAHFVNELRINYACKLLIQGNQSIKGICDEAGFNNLSNFNRRFLDLTGKSPSQYRELFKGK